jgi:hypothetical protein
MGAFLEEVGGGEVDEDAAGREGEAHGGECGADAFAGFGDGFVRQADDEEGGEAGGDLNLDFHRHGFDAGEGEAADGGEAHAEVVIITE